VRLRFFALKIRRMTREIINRTPKLIHRPWSVVQYGIVAPVRFPIAWNRIVTNTFPKVFLNSQV